MIVPEIDPAGQSFHNKSLIWTGSIISKLYRETYDRDRGSGDYEDDISCVIL